MTSHSTPENRIRKYRDKHGLSLRELAKRISDRFNETVHHTTIGKLENGKMSLTIEWAAKFAIALDEATSNILGFDDLPEVESIPIKKITKSPNWENAAISLEVLDDWHFPGSFFVMQRDISNAPLEDIRDAYGPFAGMLVLINPTYPSLIVGQYYLYRLKNGECRLGVFRETPPRFETPRGWPEGEAVWLGVTTLDVIGWAVSREERLHDGS